MAVNPIEAGMRAAVEAWGWQPGNAGENRVIAALHAAGVRPDNMAQQFRLGPYRLDLAWPRERIAIEADGWVHTTREQARRDKERDAKLHEWGWLVCRFDIDQEDDHLRAQIARLVAQRYRLCVLRAETDLQEFRAADERPWRQSRLPEL